MTKLSLDSDLEFDLNLGIYQLAVNLRGICVKFITVRSLYQTILFSFAGC